MIAGWLNKSLGQLYQLLKPIHEICLTCGRTGSFNADLPGICLSCYRSIPWITKPRCLRCGRGIGCPDCIRSGVEDRGFVLNRSAVIYDARMKEWLAQYKYRGNERYAKLLIEMLLQAFTLLHREANLHLGSMRSGNTSSKSWNIHAVTSVPVSEERLQERGFNQAEVLAQGLAHRVKTPCIRLLERKRHTDKQSFKNRMDRLRDMKEAFGPWQHASEELWYIRRQVGAMNRKAMERRVVEAFRILLVDDIYTTGSTVDACAQVLRKYESIVDMPIEVYSLTWARS